MKHIHSRILLLASFVSLCGLGCDHDVVEPRLTDTFTGESETLVANYALGSEFDIDVRDAPLGSSVHLVSSDPSVLRITRVSDRRWAAHTLAAGDVTLGLDVDGAIYHEPVRVGRPDRLRFRRLDGFRSRVEMPNPLRMATGTHEVFVVDYFEGDTRLFGAYALESRGEHAWAETLVDNQDWLVVEVLPGEQEVELGLVTGDELPPLRIEGVEAVSLELWTRPLDLEVPEDSVLVFGRGLDAEGRTLEGRFLLDWQVADRAEGPGDFLVFTPDAAAELPLVAVALGRPELRATLTVNGTGGTPIEFIDR